MNRINKIETLIKSLGEPKYRLKQILEAVFMKPYFKYDEITTISKKLREAIIEEMGKDILTIKPTKESAIAQTHKQLFELHDAQRVEAVYMSFRNGRKTLCISTQVGCACGCTFCATGSIGFIRHLTDDEIVDQVLYYNKKGLQIDNIVFMGMGEPLLNPHLFSSLKMLTAPENMGYGQRRLAISTVGIPDAMRRLTKEFPQISLTLSLHNPFDSERSLIMPVNKKYSIDQALSALEEHILETNRKAYIAYTVLSGQNDTDKHADKLVALMKRRNLQHLLHINLLNYNEHSYSRGFKSVKGATELFAQKLEEKGLNHVTVRHSFGNDIDAACGQLVADYK